MVELIAVLLIVGVLAVVAMPRLNTPDHLRGAAWRDQVQAAHSASLATAQPADEHDEEI